VQGSEASGDTQHFPVSERNRRRHERQLHVVLQQGVRRRLRRGGPADVRQDGSQLVSSEQQGRKRARHQPEYAATVKVYMEFFSNSDKYVLQWYLITLVYFKF